MSKILINYLATTWKEFKRNPLMYLIGIAAAIYWYLYAINNAWR